MYTQLITIYIYYTDAEMSMDSLRLLLKFCFSVGGFNIKARHDKM